MFAAQTTRQASTIKQIQLCRQIPLRIMAGYHSPATVVSLALSLGWVFWLARFNSTVDRRAGHDL